MKKFLSFIFIAVVFSTTLLGVETVRTGIQGIPVRFQGRYSIFNTHDMVSGQMNNIGGRTGDRLQLTSNTAYIAGMTLKLNGTSSQLSNPWLLKNNVIFKQYYSENMVGIMYGAKNSSGTQFILFMLWTPVNNAYMISCINLSTGVEFVYSAHK